MKSPWPIALLTAVRPTEVEPITRYYDGHTCQLQVLTGDDIRTLYPRPEVAVVLPVYRPWFRPLQDGLDALIQRMDWLAGMTPPPELEALVLHRATGTPLGFICLAGLDTLNAKAELAVAFFRGQGSRPALEAVHWVLESAFTRLRLYKLVFCVDPGNHPAHHFLRGLGIGREAVLREEVVNRDGQRADLWRYALTAPQWANSSARKRLQRLVPLRPDVETTA